MHTRPGLVRFGIGLGIGLGIGAAMAVAASACGGREVATGVATGVAPTVATAVATITAGVDRTAASPGSPVVITYRIAPQDGATVPDGLWMFVHLVDEQGGILWTDDHAPSVPSGQWRAAVPIAYARTTFVPRTPYTGRVSVDVGLFEPATGARFGLTGTDLGMATYRIAGFSVQPSADDVFIVFGEGWHDAETGGGTLGTSWRWTRGSAALSFRNPGTRNPGTSATVLLDLDRPVGQSADPSHVEVRIGDQIVGAFDVSGARTIQAIALPQAVMGSAPTVELRLAVRPTFVPAALPQLRSIDSRELGVRVFNAYVAPD